MRHIIKKGDAMNNEEQYILNRCGKQNPFTVPEGYFDSLRTELMQRVEVKPKDISLWKRWRGYVAAHVWLALLPALLHTSVSVLKPQRTNMWL